MASLESLAADQRAVLQLVLDRGRNYDDIGRLLSIDRAAVRERAQQALDALGPRTPLLPERRALIADYLLGQLPARVSEEVAGHLAGVAAERAWASAVAFTLAPVASRPLPEIPVARSAPEAESREPGGPVGSPEPTIPELEASITPLPAPTPLTPSGAPATPPRAQSPAPAPRAGPPGSEQPRQQSQPATPGYGYQYPRPAGTGRGGMVLLALGGLVAVVGIIVIVIVLTSTGSNRTSPAHRPIRHTLQSTTTSAASTPSSPAKRVIAAAKLVSPTGRVRPIGVGDLLQIGTRYGIGIVAQGLPPSSPHAAYGVWLYNSPSDSRFLGFPNPSVGANGNLKVGKVLVLSPARFKQMLITLETVQPPHRPGRVVLRGTLKTP